MAKYFVKQGVKKGLKEFVEKQVKKRLKKYLTNGQLKDAMGDIADIIDMLDSEWWEVCLEFVPVAGDLYGGGKLAVKTREAYKKLQDLENHYLEKAYRALPDNAARKKFLDRLRADGVSDAWKDEGAMVKNTGKGTKEWDIEELDTLSSGNKIKGYEGHHSNSVKEYPGQAGDPRNIEFETRPDHFGTHDSNWQNPTHGGNDLYRN